MLLSTNLKIVSNFYFKKLVVNPKIVEACFSRRNVSTNNLQGSLMPYRSKKIYQGPLKAVIFDWAGTVVDSGVKAPLITFVQLFKNEHIEITEDEARGPMGAHKRVHIEKILQLERVNQAWLQKNGSPPNDSDVDRMYAQFVPTIKSCIHQHSDVIKGVSETVTKIRKDLNLKIGSTTGFPEEVLNILVESASKQGYIPDANIAADQVPMARPCPYMVWACAMKMAVHPIQAIVKVDDTVDGISEGIAAGCWTIGVAKTSNYIGLNETELENLPEKILQSKLAKSYDILANSGAHYVIDTVNDIPRVLTDINLKLQYGEQP